MALLHVGSQKRLLCLTWKSELCLKFLEDSIPPVENAIEVQVLEWMEYVPVFNRLGSWKKVFFSTNAQMLILEAWIDIGPLVGGGSIQVQMLKYWFQKHGLI